MKNSDDIKVPITYEQLNQNYNIQDITKQSVIDFTSSKYMTQIYVIFIATILLYLFIVYFIKILIDALILSLIGFLLSRIIGVRFKYKSIFNMSVYSLTLSIILCLIYIVVNIFTGFQIIYFDIAYDGIAYIYIITAMLMIKSDLIKQQIEVGQIVEEQKKVRQEKQEEENKKEEKKEDNKEQENKKEKKKKDKNEDEGTPEGSNA